jgi:hypothetical protein
MEVDACEISPSLAALSLLSHAPPKPWELRVQREDDRQAVIDCLALAALVPGPSEPWRQMGSIIECSIDKLRPPQQQISAGWKWCRGRRKTGLHLYTSSSWEVSRASYSRLSFKHKQPEPWNWRRLQCYLVSWSLSSINN